MKGILLRTHGGQGCIHHEYRLQKALIILKYVQFYLLRVLYGRNL